jgi:hypothetical protein
MSLTIAGEPWKVLFNRGLALFAIRVTAFTKEFTEITEKKWRRTV